MIKKPITINLSTGLEARPVAQLVQVASQFNSEIYVEIGKKRVNAKSIMGMMTLGLELLYLQMVRMRKLLWQVLSST